MKFKKLISLICTLCMVSTYAFVPSFGTSAVTAAAADVSQYLNSDKSGAGTAIVWSSDTATDNGDSSITVNGTMKSGDNWYAHRTEIGFNDIAMGSGVAQTIGHTGWVIDNPNNLKIDLAYRNGSTRSELAVWDMSTGVFKDKANNNFAAIVNAQSYQGDFFINLETTEYRIYINNILFSEGSIGTSQFRNLFLNVRPDVGSFTFTVSNVTREIYNSGATMADVVAYTFKNRSANNYYWIDNGMGDIGGTDGKRIVGNIDWVNSSEPSYSGSNVVVPAHATNTDGGLAYKLRILKSNGTYKEKGCLPQDSENDNIIHQSVTITPNISSDNYAAIGFRGNQSDALGKYKFGPDNGFVNGRAYHFDILVNNKDKEYWILVDGEKRANGNVGKDYLSNISYTIHNAGSDTISLSNIVTTSYDYTVSMDDLLSNLVNASNYNWSFDGFDLYNTSIASGYGTRNEHVDYYGNNTAGYVVTANADAAYWQYRLGNGNQVALPANTTEDNIIHQHLSFTPYFASGNKLTLGIRGNNAWQEDLLTVNADNGFVSGTEYDMHIIINNKNRSYMYIINGIDGKDGVVKASGTSWGGRYPYWELVYYIDKSGDSMKLKNVTTKYYKNTVSLYDLTSNLIETNDAVSDFRFDTDENGYLAEELEDFACFDPDKWYVQTSKRFFSNNKAIAPRATNTNDMATNPYISLNLSFNAHKKGTNTYYMWVRHTASVIKQDGRNFFLAIDTDGTAQPDFKSYTAEATAPRWMLLGSITLSADETSYETGYVRIRERQSSHVAWDKYVITTDQSYVPTDAAFGIYPPSSSRAKPMGTLSGGKLAFEAENVGYDNNVFERLTGVLDGYTYDWYYNYSNSKALKVSDHAATTPTNWNDATGTIDPGDIEFNFTPDSNGSAYVWMKYYSTSTNKYLSVSVNSNDYTQVDLKTKETHTWTLISAIDNVTAGIPVNIRIKDQTGGYAIDKFAISNSIFDTPSGDSPNWSPKSTALSGGSPSVNVNSLPSHPRLYFTDDDVAKIKTASGTQENKFMNDLNNSYITTGLREEFTGEIPASPGYSNYKPDAVTRIEALAYDYAVNGNTASGYKAASSLVNYITHVSYTDLKEEAYTRTAGYDLYTLSKAYDWCYDCLTDAQKTEFINAGIKIASQFETGWPPVSNSEMTGFKSEGVFQDYLLAFAIAVADEKPEIYNYIVGKVESDYVPANIKLYSGVPMQGTRYGTYRGQHAFASALMLKTIGYENETLYSALADTMMGYIYARRPDGLMFIDGDDTNNDKTPYSHYDVGHMRTMFLHAIKLFGDDYGVGGNSYFKEAAKWACSSSKEFSDFDGSYGKESYITPSTFLILNGDKDIGSGANYSLPLSKYFGGGVGTMIARTGWTEFSTSNINTLPQNDSSAVAYMKAGIYNAGNHQHLDAGNFQLYYKGILANDPCYYTGSNYSSAYRNGYAKQSVAHNVVLVNNIGQKAVDDANSVGDAVQTAEVKANAIAGDDVNQPDFTYLKADLKNAYDSSYVSNYTRSFMFMNMNDSDEPAALIVFDNLKTKNSSHKASWLLHGLNNPSINGKRAVFSTTTGGKMTNDTLLPANVSINTRADGYVSASESYSSGYPSAQGKVNESDGYRIEVSPSTQTTNTYFLNVIQASDSAVTPDVPVSFESTDFYGVRLKDRVVLFGKGLDWFGETKETEYYFNFSSDDGYVYKIAMADAYTGSYEIFWSPDGSSYPRLAYAKTTDNASHLLTFSGKAGYYKVVRKSNTTGGATTSYAASDELKQLSPAVKIRQSGGNYIISASAKTYRSYAKPDSREYANKVILAAYDSTGKVLGLRIVDFTSTDKEADYVDIATLTSAPSGKITVKSMLFNSGTIYPLTKLGIVDFLN